MKTTDINATMIRLAELEQMKKQLEKEIEDTKNIIQDAMGDSETLETPMFTIRYTTMTTSRFDSKSFKADMPHLYPLYCKATESRRFSYQRIA